MPDPRCGMPSSGSSASNDPDGDVVHRRWSFVQLPLASQAELNDPTVENPSFLADEPGDYVISLIVDDGYLRSDAAVVFQRVDENTGQARYIYHGNDGTSMPWNDTAQLNFLLPEVREAVTRVILDVARRFPIIRFDAAMTLARKHYQRLWFPAPGDAGAIPSRAEHGMTREAFRERAAPLRWPRHPKYRHRESAHLHALRWAPCDAVRAGRLHVRHLPGGAPPRDRRRRSALPHRGQQSGPCQLRGEGTPAQWEQAGRQSGPPLCAGQCQ